MNLSQRLKAKARSEVAKQQKKSWPLSNWLLSSGSGRLADAKEFDFICQLFLFRPIGQSGQEMPISITICAALAR